MRIHRIELCHYRGVDHVAVSLPASGVTVIEGPNEVGKSSLIEAVQLLLDYRDTSTDKRVRSVTPTHGEAIPEATVELSTGHYRLTYTKRWHRKHGTTSLLITEPVHEQVHGREAHERVEAILAETLDRPLWDALRFEQGATLDGGGFTGARSLSRALDLAAGGAAEVDQADGLWDRIVAERDRYWYTTGKPRLEGVGLGRAVAHAETELAAATAQVTALDLLTEEAGTLDATAEGLLHRVQATTRRVADLVARAEAVASRRSEARSASEARNAARADEARLRADQQQRSELVRRGEQATDAASTAERSCTEGAPRQASAEVAHQAATEALASSHRALAGAEASHQLAVGDRDHARQRIEVAQLTERLHGAAIARAEAHAAEQVLATNPVTAERLAAVTEAHLEVVRAAAAAEVSATTVEAIALAPTDLVVDGETRSLGPDQRHQLAVSATTEIVVPGVARIVVRAGVEAAERAERLHGAEEQLAHLCAALGAAEVSEVRAAAAAREAAAATLTRARADLARCRRDLTDEALAQKVERLTERIAVYAATRTTEPAPPADLSDAQQHAVATESVFDQARASVAAHETAHRRTDRAQREAEVATSAITAQLELARRTARQETEALAVARGRASDEQLADGAARSTEARMATDQTLVEAQAALREIDPEGTDAALVEAQRAEAQANREYQINRNRRQELRILLEVRGEEGLAQRVDEAATRHQHAERAREGWRRRAEAARHLHEVFAARRQETRRRYEAPLAERIEELGRVVFGPSLRVRLDAELAIAARTVDGTTLAFDQLSTGAREQLGVLSRLACATLVDPDEGVPVILDDVLGWTDPQRLVEVAAAITAAGHHAQVIVLTCTPERFAALQGATTVHLGPEPPSQAAPAPTVRRPTRRRGGAPGNEPTLFPVEERPAS